MSRQKISVALEENLILAMLAAKDSHHHPKRSELANEAAKSFLNRLKGSQDTLTQPKPPNHRSRLTLQSDDAETGSLAHWRPGISPKHLKKGP
jgi:hypothetical protein